MISDHASGAPIEIYPVTGLGEFGPGSDIAGEIIGAAERSGGPGLRDGDVLVVTSKIFSKTEGRMVPAPTAPEERDRLRRKLISEETGQPIGSTNGIIRQFAHIVDSVICYIGWLFPLWDAKRQTIADKIMKTVVVDNSTDPNAGNYNWNL